MYNNNSTKIFPNEYQNIKKLKGGTYGNAYLVNNLKDNTKSVIKKYKKYKEYFDADMIKEMIIYYNYSNHPNIVQYKNFFNFNNTYNLEMENMNGDIENYYDYTPNIIKKCIYQMLLAVDYLHSHGIVHSDIKPANILYDGSNFKLCDFGISSYVGLPYVNKKLICTEGYIAPECLDDRLKKKFYKEDKHLEEQHNSCDVFSIGALLFYYCLGKYNKDIIYCSDYNKILNNPSRNIPNHWNKYGDTYYCKGNNYTTKTKPLTEYNISNKISIDGYNLLSEMLQIHPSKRITVSNALESPYFSDIHKKSNLLVKNNLSYELQYLDMRYNKVTNDLKDHSFTIDDYTWKQLYITIDKLKFLNYMDETYMFAVYILEYYYKNTNIKDLMINNYKYCLFVSQLFLEYDYHLLDEFSQKLKLNFSQSKTNILHILHTIDYKIIHIPHYFFIYYYYIKYILYVDSHIYANTLYNKVKYNSYTSIILNEKIHAKIFTDAMIDFRKKFLNFESKKYCIKKLSYDSVKVVILRLYNFDIDKLNL